MYIYIYVYMYVCVWDITLSASRGCVYIEICIYSHKTRRRDRYSMIRVCES